MLPEDEVGSIIYDVEVTTIYLRATFLQTRGSLSGRSGWEQGHSRFSKVFVTAIMHRIGKLFPLADRAWMAGLDEVTEMK